MRQLSEKKKSKYTHALTHAHWRHNSNFMYWITVTRHIVTYAWLKMGSHRQFALIITIYIINQSSNCGMHRFRFSSHGTRILLFLHGIPIVSIAREINLHNRCACIFFFTSAADHDLHHHRHPIEYYDHLCCFFYCWAFMQTIARACFRVFFVSNLPKSHNQINPQTLLRKSVS